MNTTPTLIGSSASIEKIRELIEHTADTGLNVLITGETGVGKEVVALNLYLKSQRKDKPFIRVNCAALPAGLLESEIFGYERGAFTGAERKKRGKFELAHKGVLLLDEIGDMPLALQAKLLHVLQSGEFSPLGSEKEITADVWVIASTNQNLWENVKKGLFREDLYYRLNIIKIYIPPLRERPQDIPLLIDHYLTKYTSQFANKKFTSPGHNITEKMISYHWPGNIRELENIIKSYIVVGNWEEVVEDLIVKDKSGSHLKNKILVQDQGEAEVHPTGILKYSEELKRGPNTEIGPKDFFEIASNINSASNPKRLEKALIADYLSDLKDENSPEYASFSLQKSTKNITRRIEKEIITFVLDKTRWNRTKASKILKISYKTLLYKISDLDIRKQREL